MKQFEDPANRPMVIENLHAVDMFPPISDRKAWEALLKDPSIRTFRDGVIADAEKLLDTPILELPATRFMDCVRNGNRSRYEELYFARRTRLETLFLAEAFEYKGRFTDGLIDTIWAIIGEPTWCLPPHAALAYYLDERDDPKMDDPIPYFGFEVVDIFSAETSVCLSTVYRLAYDELKAVSPGFVRRLRDVILERAVRTFDKSSRYYWLHIQENWNSWICSNLLCTVNNMLRDDPAQMTRFVKNLLQPSMDSYMRKYTDDGCCDEGPRYWTLSPCCAMFYYEILYQQSDGKCSLYDSPKFRKMGEYAADAVIGDDYYVNFADCPAHCSFRMSLGIARRFAERTGSTKLNDFCINFRAKHPRAFSNDLVRTIADLFMEKPGTAAARGDYDIWYNIRQLLIVKSGRIHFAAKGGSNHENHNHNDVGQFILAADGMPFAVDLGCPEYTRETFSLNRYRNPIINSLYHNVPAFNGQGQADGDEFEACDVQFEKTGNLYHLSMELAGTYPEKLGIVSCRRVLELDLDAKTLTVTDEWQTKEPSVFSLTLFTTSSPEKAPYTMESTLPLNTEKFNITDPDQKKEWVNLWISTLASPKAVSGKNVLKFTLKG